MAQVDESPVVVEAEQLIPQLQELTARLQDIISRYQAKYAAPIGDGRLAPPG